jgi:uncharacterized membrane protein YkvA (DUF1232 family)
MSSTLTASLEERIDQATLQHVREQAVDAGPPQSAAPAPQGWLSRFVEENVAKRFGQRHLIKLATQRGKVAQAWREVPGRMHQVANQTKLMMELVDDFRSGEYRKIPWRSLALVVGAILYVGSPADVLPDLLVGLGLLDDLAVAAFVARVVRNDLQAYCEFKGYSVGEYFPN